MRSKIILAIAACGLVAACGGKSDQTTKTETAPPAALPSPSVVVPSAAATTAAVSSDQALKTAVQAYSDAFLTGDAKTAYGLLSERCRKRTTPAEFSGTVEAAKQMYGSALPLKTFSASVSGDLARVTYTYAIKAINQDREPWVREGGAWHEDDC